MKIEIIAFGIAKDILKDKSVHVDVDRGSSVADIKEKLVQDFPDFGALASLRLAVNAEYVADDYELQKNDEVVLIPPVSGG